MRTESLCFVGPQRQCRGTVPGLLIFNKGLASQCTTVKQRRTLRGDTENNDSPSDSMLGAGQAPEQDRPTAHFSPVEGGGGIWQREVSFFRLAPKSPRREIFRSSPGAAAIQPPFLGVIQVAYPKT